MNSEIKNCQNCKKDFTIEPDDFLFYEKIKVPPPTFCPECRMVRRMIWRNCRSLYKRPCFNCNKTVISMYSPLKTNIVYCMDCWNSDDRDPFLQGRDYDFARNFFEQLNELRIESPILFSHHTGTLIRSDFTNYSVDDKDCYLSYSVITCENILYSENIDKSKNDLDCYSVQKVENCSYNIDCDINYNCHFSIQSQKCIDSYFIYDCINCQNCCLSSNLRNKQYIFKNKQLTKEEYKDEFLKLKLNKYSELCKAKEYFDNDFKNKAIHRFAQIYNSQNATGDYIGNSKNVFNSFVIQNSENIKYGYRILSNSKDSYDAQGLASGELIYESIATSFMTSRDYFTYICIGSKECEYSFMCKNCSNCFACIGLKNSQYCIFNKQYKKEEYFEMIDKIKKHMNDMPYVDIKGRVYKYGELFPYEMSPFGYNETNANEYFSISKEEAVKRGYPWKDKEEKNYNITIDSNNLPDDINEVAESIFNEIISCPNDGKQEYLCSTAYRIIPEELQFLKQKNLPLPRYCPNCRHFQRLEYRNYFKLYSRSCMNKNCQNVFNTTYAPDRPEIIYCEKCYQNAVI
jgi:hypothetical protein